MANTYGGSCPHGGGAFSGKILPKSNETGAYMARSQAKNIVAAGLADKCLVRSHLCMVFQSLFLYL